MINHYELEQATLRGIEEFYNEYDYLYDDGWFEDENKEVVGEWQGEEIVEALYAKFLGYTN